MKRLHTYIVAGVALAFLPLLSGASERPQVVVTTTMLTDMVRQVGGDAVEVHGLMGPGVDPHLYRASASDIARLRRADLIVYNGLQLEGRLGEVIQRLQRSGRRVIAVGETLPEEVLLPSDEEDEIWDPHVWFSPELWALCVDGLLPALQALVPSHSDALSERAVAYRQEIETTGEWGQERLRVVPAEHRILVTSHDAFNYFGRYFDFEVEGIQGISTASEAGLANLALLADVVKERKVPAIFMETSVSPRAIRRLSNDTGAVIGGELYSDATGTPGRIETGSDGESYDVGTWSGMMRHNINVIADALEGSN